MRLNYGLFISMAIFCMYIVIPLSSAMVNPSVDIKISRAEIDFLYMKITVDNPYTEDIYLTGLNYSISSPIGASGSEKWGTPRIIKPNESITHSSKHHITSGDPLKRFYHQSSANITVSGSLSMETDSNSFVIPFHETTTIHTETDEANQATSPYFTDVKFKVNKLTDDKGVIKMIITSTNISIFNPNPVAFNLQEFYCEITAMQKNDENMSRLKPLSDCGYSTSNTRLIMPNKISVYNFEKTISDNDTIQYFISEEPKYIRVKGSSFLIANEIGWSPAYFEPDFNTIITINGEEHTASKNQTPTSTIPEKTYGFKAIYVITGVLVAAYFSKRFK